MNERDELRAILECYVPSLVADNRRFQLVLAAARRELARMDAEAAKEDARPTLGQVMDCVRGTCLHEAEDCMRFKGIVATLLEAVAEFLASNQKSWIESGMDFTKRVRAITKPE